MQYAKDNLTITGAMLCASGTTAKGVTDACQGDSGGPLASWLKFNHEQCSATPSLPGSQNCLCLFTPEVCMEGERFVIAGATWQQFESFRVLDRVSNILQAHGWPLVSWGDQLGPWLWRGRISRSLCACLFGAWRLSSYVLLHLASPVSTSGHQCLDVVKVLAPGPKPQIWQQGSAQQEITLWKFETTRPYQ